MGMDALMGKAKVIKKEVVSKPKPKEKGLKKLWNKIKATLKGKKKKK